MRIVDLIGGARKRRVHELGKSPSRATLAGAPNAFSDVDCALFVRIDRSGGRGPLFLGLVRGAQEGMSRRVLGEHVNAENAGAPQLASLIRETSVKRLDREPRRSWSVNGPDRR
jgi:hypothetical protein